MAKERNELIIPLKGIKPGRTAKNRPILKLENMGPPKKFKAF